MNASINIQTSLIFLLVTLLFAACNSKKDEHTHEAEEYTCPMHAQVLQDRPGSCPVCGMDLVKKSSKSTEVAITEDLKNLAKPTNSSVIASIKTVHPERKSLTANTTASGVINYDTRKTFSVPVRFSGRIEKLFVKYNYQAVTKGQVIMEVYSPEMVTAQRELLYVASEHKSDKKLLESAKQKLLLLGLTESQIERIIATGKESFTLPVLSPYSGYIVESIITNSFPQLPQELATSSGMNSTKNGSMSQASQPLMSNASAASSQQISIREGTYVNAGQSLFKVVDGTRLWAELYFPSPQADRIRVGNAVELHIGGSNTNIPSHIDFIQPFFSEGTQFLQVRSYLSTDKNKFRVGQLITGKIAHEYKDKLWIPRQAVLDLGVQQIVFLKGNGNFTPIKVKTGANSDDMIEIIDGLDESSEVAINAQYMIDSESFIKADNQ